MGDQSIHLTFLSNLNSNIDQSYESIHLFQEGILFLEKRFCRFFPLPGVDVPPRVSLLVVEEEEGASDEVGEEGGQDADKGELSVGVEVRSWQESRVLVFHQIGGHGPGDQDVDACHAHRPADFSTFTNLFFHLVAPQGHGDPGVGQDVEQPLALGQVPESRLILGEAAVEDGDGDPPEDDGDGDEDCSL